MEKIKSQTIRQSGIDDIILKRACGFYYTEEVCEYEKQKDIKMLYCKNRKRVYFKSGSFLALVSVKGEKPNENKFFIRNIKQVFNAKNGKKNLKKLKILVKS